MPNDTERVRALVTSATSNPARKPIPEPLKHKVTTRWMTAMRAGDFEAAWQATDRIELPRRAGVFDADDTALRWDGRPFAGQRVRVRCLHGLGDTLQFMRFVPAIAAQARELHFLVQPPLLDLLHGAPGLGAVSNAWTDHPPQADVEIEVMELAYALRAQANALPAPYPHLGRQLPGTFPVRLAQDDRVRVGLLWAASDWDQSRSMPLAALRDLLRLPGFAFYSLQQGPEADDALTQPDGLVPLSAHTRSIRDAANAMSRMDLVITIDGMPAHLAATLGRPTWLMLKHDADWRWMEGRSDSPWYPTMRLFRQPREGDWDGAVRELGAALQASSFRRSGRSAA